jgi:hypothetical protein
MEKTVWVIAMFVLALGYFISTLVLFGIISTLIVEFWYDQIIMKFRHVSQVNTTNLFVFSWLLQAKAAQVMKNATISVFKPSVPLIC